MAKAASESIKNVNIADLNILENSRLRTEEDLSELMKSIKQVGVLQPILVRKKDNAVIMGNRRLTACKKLGIKTVPAILKDNLADDTDLYIMNLAENIQRKDISTIEIGRFCSGFKSGKLTGIKLSVPEISTRLGIPEGRVNTCINIFEKLPKKFRKDVAFFGKGGNTGFGVPETVVNSILAIHKNMKKLSDREFSTILSAVKNKSLQPYQLNALGNLLASGVDIDDALKKIDQYTLKQLTVLINKKALGKALNKNKCHSAQELIKKMLMEEDSSLVI